MGRKQKRREQAMVKMAMLTTLLNLIAALVELATKLLDRYSGGKGRAQALLFLRPTPRLTACCGLRVSKTLCSFRLPLCSEYHNCVSFATMEIALDIIQVICSAATLVLLFVIYKRQK